MIRILRLAPAILRRRRAMGGEQIITGTKPTLDAMTIGDTLGSAVTWGSYTSTAGVIASPTVKHMRKDDGPWLAYNAATVVSFPEIWTIRETVTDDAGTPARAFSAARATSGIAPSITASDALVGRTLTITVDSVTGNPAPTVSLYSLTSNGNDVLANVTGSGPWVYVTPSSSAAEVLAWAVSATNGALPNATDTGGKTVAANLFAPTVAASYSISGDLVTITVDSTSGTPAPVSNLTTLTLDGVDVLGDASGSGPWTYTVPDSNADQALVWEVTASNGIDPDATDGGTETIQGAAPLWIMDGGTWNDDGIWDDGAQWEDS